MNSALWVSKTGLAAQDTAMATVANNLANVNTNGFKSDRAVFEDLFYSIEKQPGAQADEINTVPSGIQLGSGVRVAGTQKVFTEGSIQTTGQPMDLAIVGRGFFQVEAPNGDILYTENGQFQLNAEGVMVNAQGLPLAPAIEVPQGSTGFTVGADGIVTAVLPGDTLPSELGQITLVNFTNPGAWKHWAATSIAKASPAAKRWKVCRAKRAWASSSRACWRAPTCRWSRPWWR